MKVRVANYSSYNHNYSAFILEVSINIKLTKKHIIILKSSTNEVNKYTTWYAYERFYSTIDKRFINKDPVVNLYEKERVNSYIYAGDNPLKNIDLDGRSFICKVVNSTVFKKAMDLCEGIYDVTSFALNRAYKDVVKPLADIYNKASDIMDKIPTPEKLPLD